jgi:two-component system invasion response regulator UvrY
MDIRSSGWRLIIADDHSVVREGLRRILRDFADFETIDAVWDGQTLLDAMRRKRYDLVILDLAMPGRSGLDILKQLVIEQPGVPVLVLSIYPEENFAVRTLRAGAAGYISKDAEFEKLIDAVRTVASGRKYISSAVAEMLLKELSTGHARAPHELLSDRELQVFLRIAEGRTVTEIAHRMFLSVKTISTYRRRILEKMNLRNNSDIARYAIENNLMT